MADHTSNEAFRAIQALIFQHGRIVLARSSNTGMLYQRPTRMAVSARGMSLTSIRSARDRLTVDQIALSQVGLKKKGRPAILWQGPSHLGSDGRRWMIVPSSTS